MNRAPPRWNLRAAFVPCLASALGSGCASTVVPPDPPADPATVLVLSHGRHAGLFLPAPADSGTDGAFVEYGYGDWTWYALGRTDCWRAPLIVLWPNAGALGRRSVEAGALDAEYLHSGATLTPLTVSHARAAALLAQLDAEFAAAPERRFNAEYDMEFARHPRRFWMFHTCADEVAEWLEELGCRVSAAPMRTRLKLPPDVAD